MSQFPLGHAVVGWYTRAQVIICINGHLRRKWPSGQAQRLVGLREGHQRRRRVATGCRGAKRTVFHLIIHFSFRFVSFNSWVDGRYSFMAVFHRPSTEFLDDIHTMAISAIKRRFDTDSFRISNLIFQKMNRFVLFFFWICQSGNAAIISIVSTGRSINKKNSKSMNYSFFGWIWIIKQKIGNSQT